MFVGIKRILPDADIVILPMADGGEGTVEALVYSTSGRIITSEVTGPLGDKVSAHWGVLGDNKTAVIEMAAASGINLVSSSCLDPTLATTRGTGELILEALENGCRKLIIGIGGSATNDGGAGMAQALGVRLIDSNGNDLKPGGTALQNLDKIDISGLDVRIKECTITVACDVTNTLCGRQGASFVYGPQKGASQEMCQNLDSALTHYALIVERDLGVDILNLSGGGAAGGLGAGLVAFLGAKLLPGVDIIIEAMGLVNYLKNADLILTGEGKVDSQTMFGKTVAGVAREAKQFNVPVIVVAGAIEGAGEELYQHGVTALLSITPGPITLEESVANARNLIADCAERAMRLVLINPC